MRIVFLFLFSLSSLVAGIDKKVEKDDSTFWEVHKYVPYLQMATIGTLALKEGTDSRFGKTLWKSLDALAMDVAVVYSTKFITGRERPEVTDNPSLWFESNSFDSSFPSGHVSVTTAMITPIVLEYKDDYPLVHSLWLLSAYQMVGRVKAQKHWQSDVIVGALIGYGIGYYAFERDENLLLSITPEGVKAGLKFNF